MPYSSPTLSKKRFEYYNTAIVEKFVSIIIPNYNGGATIDKCLEAAFASAYGSFEVIVVDDCSSDDSVGTIKKFPCRLVRLGVRTGASGARNAGALNSRGDILFFTDADCLMSRDALSMANRTLAEKGPGTVVGGTYTCMPPDRTFFSIFQSVFVNYSETKRPGNPDYVATHAMAIDARTFRDSGGFREDFLPIIEDVEFSHRLRRSGFTLMINPEMLVSHIFNFSLDKSLRNAFKKTMYWIVYSAGNKDLLADSGTASSELKTNGVVWLINVFLLLLSLAIRNPAFLAPVPAFFAADLFINRKLLSEFYRTGGLLFAAGAALYYTTLYPLAIWAGVCAGAAKYLQHKANSRK